MSLESKKRRRIARAAARRTGEVAIAQTRVAPATTSVLRGVMATRNFDASAPLPPLTKRYIPSWLNTCSAPSWTPRLKRHGGMMMIEAHRERQFEQIDSTIRSMMPVKAQLLAGWRDWLLENKRRLLSSDIEEFFWPQDAA